MDRSAPLVDVKLSLSVYDQRLHSVMQIDVSSFYRRSCYSYIKRRVYDSKGAVFVLPELTLPPSVLGPQHSVSFFPLAETFAPGEARYVSQPSYVCSWFDHLVPIRLPDRVAEFYVPPADKRAP